MLIYLMSNSPFFDVHQKHTKKYRLMTYYIVFIPRSEDNNLMNVIDDAVPLYTEAEFSLNSDANRTTLAVGELAVGGAG